MKKLKVGDQIFSTLPGYVVTKIESDEDWWVKIPTKGIEVKASIPLSFFEARL
jgi:hypothetical protein